MSHEQNSACIPPPSNYKPRAQSKYNNHPRGRGSYQRYNTNHPGRIQEKTFSSTTASREERSISQPKDRFHRDDDEDYFASVQDEGDVEEEPPSGTDVSQNNNEHRKPKSDEAETSNDANDDGEDDPLDAYMKSLESETHTKPLKAESELKSNNPEVPEHQSTVENTTTTREFDSRGVRLDIDGMDDLEETYIKYAERQTKSNRSSLSGEGTCDDNDEQQRQELIEYDKDGNVLGVRKLKREIDPLPALDHSQISYAQFDKVFYSEHEEITKLTSEQSEALRCKLDIKVSGDNPPKPVCSFAHFRFDEQLMRVIRHSEYTQPTPIQAQAIPAALSGRNVIGIAMTGSGKTAAYLWPMIVHIMGQPDLRLGDGPIGLVLVPTRELAIQVHGEAKKFSKTYNIATVCAYGGGSKYEQTRDLEAGAEIVVATPGRLIDLIKAGATNLRRVTYLVLDEADRFFDMGFEPQVRSICDHVRPDRQTLLFSATFKKKIEQLARTVTDKPIKIVQRALGEANEDVTQHVIIVPSTTRPQASAFNAPPPPDQTNPHKYEWLKSRLVEFTSAGGVLIFVTRIVHAEDLHRRLRESNTETLLLHGDMEQSERNRVITAFKKQDKRIMIATDVAARGLDIAHIKTVINYDAARDIDTHTHRVGRTGRAGSKGDAYTLLTDRDKEFAAHLVKNLDSSNQIISNELKNLARQSQSFRRNKPHNQHYHHHHHKYDDYRNTGCTSSSSTFSQQQDYHDRASTSHRDKEQYQQNRYNHNQNPQQSNHYHQSVEFGRRDGGERNNNSDFRRHTTNQGQNYDKSEHRTTHKRARWS